MQRRCPSAQAPSLHRCELGDLVVTSLPALALGTLTFTGPLVSVCAHAKCFLFFKLYLKVRNRACGPEEMSVICAGRGWGGTAGSPCLANWLIPHSVVAHCFWSKLCQPWANHIKAGMSPQSASCVGGKAPAHIQARLESPCCLLLPGPASTASELSPVSHCFGWESGRPLLN